MVNFADLSNEDLAKLAGSRFGWLRAAEVPDDWRQQLLMRVSHEVCFICGQAGPCGHREQGTGTEWRRPAL